MIKSEIEFSVSGCQFFFSIESDKFVTFVKKYTYVQFSSFFFQFFKTFFSMNLKDERTQQLQELIDKFPNRLV